MHKHTHLRHLPSGGINRWPRYSFLLATPPSLAALPLLLLLLLVLLWLGLIWGESIHFVRQFTSLKPWSCTPGKLNSFSRHYSLIFFQHFWILWCRVCLTMFASPGMTRNAVLKYQPRSTLWQSGVTAINTGVITSVGGGLSCQLTNHKRYAQLQLADRDAANIHLGEASLIWSPCPWWLLGRGCGLEIMGVVHLRLTTLFPPLLQRNINVINMNNSWVSSWSVTLRYASQEVFQFAAKLPCKLKS